MVWQDEPSRIFARSSELEVSMSKRCQLTGTTVLYGNHVSHANNKRRRRFLPNLQYKRIWDDEQKRFVRLRLTTRAIKTVTKKGLQAMLRDAQR